MPLYGGSRKGATAINHDDRLAFGTSRSRSVAFFHLEQGLAIEQNLETRAFGHTLRLGSPRPGEAQRRRRRPEDWTN